MEVIPAFGERVIGKRGSREDEWELCRGGLRVLWHRIELSSNDLDSDHGNVQSFDRSMAESKFAMRASVEKALHGDNVSFPAPNGLTEGAISAASAEKPGQVPAWW